MKSTIRLSSGISCLALLACSTAAEAPGGQAGASSSTAGATTGGAGAPAGAGASAGGAPGAGAPGTAGAAVGGASAGSSATAGASGSSTSTAGAGGSVTSAGAGGSTTTAGAGGAAAGGGAAVDTTLTGAFDGALLQFPCGGGNPNYDCSEPSPCANASASQDAQAIKPAGGPATSWTMGGTTGTMYDVKVHIQGVVEPSWYHDGTRSAGTSSVDVASTVAGAKPYAKDLFQTGGTRLMFSTDNGNGFDYNSYELDVTPAGGGKASVYFLNSVIPTENPHTSSKTQHLSFEIDEMPTLKIPGGATISLTMRDSNCTLVQNCGTSNNNMCGNGARSVPFTGSQPAPPSSWTGKTTSGTGGNLNGQFVHFDVISVTVAQ